MITVREAVTEDKAVEFLDEITEDDRWESEEVPKVFDSYLHHERSAVYSAILEHAAEKELIAELLNLVPENDKACAYVVSWSDNEELVGTLIRYLRMLDEFGDVNAWQHETTGNVFIELGPGTTENPSEEFMYCYTPDYETRNTVNLATRLKENQLEEL